MSNLEDVFLRINQEYAPDLFSDLKGHYARKSIRASDNSNTKNQFKSIGHSTEQTSSLDASKGAFSQAVLDQIESTGSESPNQSDDEIDQYEVDEDDEGRNLIRGSSCVRSCSASGAKRVIIYKRDWCGLICQIVIPITLVIFGLWL